MKGHSGFTVLVERRIFQLRRTVKYDTQRLRIRTIGRLDHLFAVATSIANGDGTWQRVGGKEQPITLKQRQM